MGRDELKTAASTQGCKQRAKHGRGNDQRQKTALQSCLMHYCGVLENNDYMLVLLQDVAKALNTLTID